MTKYLVTCSQTRLVFRKVKSTGSPLAVVYSHLYRIDDKLFVSDVASPDSFIAYDIEEQQPWGRGEYLDPEFTKVMIDSMKISKGKPTKMFDINSEAIIGIVIAAVVGISLISQWMGG